MRSPLLLAVLVSLGLPAGAALAQDGVFDMGQLTGTLSQDHNTQRERARARQQRVSPQAQARRRAQFCAQVPTFRAQYGAGDARVARLAILCRRAGYRTS